MVLRSANISKKRRRRIPKDRAPKRGSKFSSHDSTTTLETETSGADGRSVECVPRGAGVGVVGLVFPHHLDQATGAVGTLHSQTCRQVGPVGRVRRPPRQLVRGDTGHAGEVHDAPVREGHAAFRVHVGRSVDLTDHEIGRTGADVREAHLRAPRGVHALSHAVPGTDRIRRTRAVRAVDVSVAVVVDPVVADLRHRLSARRVAVAIAVVAVDVAVHVVIHAVRAARLRAGEASRVAVAVAVVAVDVTVHVVIHAVRAARFRRRSRAVGGAVDRHGGGLRHATGLRELERERLDPVLRAGEIRSRRARVAEVAAAGAGPVDAIRCRGGEPLDGDAVSHADVVRQRRESGVNRAADGRSLHDGDVDDQIAVVVDLVRNVGSALEIHPLGLLAVAVDVEVRLTGTLHALIGRGREGQVVARPHRDVADPEGEHVRVGEEHDLRLIDAVAAKAVVHRREGRPRCHREGGLEAARLDPGLTVVDVDGRDVAVLAIGTVVATEVGDATSGGEGKQDGREAEGLLVIHL